MLEEFLAADIVVIGAPDVHFTIPSQLKAWIDRIVIAGKTFRYGAAGAEGLAGGKRVIIAVSRGGFYGAGTPAAAMEHLETYLRGVFGFIGVTDLEIIVAEGLLVGAGAAREIPPGRLAGRDRPARGVTDRMTLIVKTLSCPCPDRAKRGRSINSSGHPTSAFQEKLDSRLRGE